MTMFRLPVKQWGVWCRSALAAVIAVATLIVGPAFADPPGQQIEDFYYPDGTQVMGDGGMPFAHAALFRFTEQQTSGVMWQIMTQDLVPRARYDIWIVGPNDGSEEGAFLWWLGSASDQAPTRPCQASRLLFNAIQKNASAK
jgi:hypothetical protein